MFNPVDLAKKGNQLRKMQSQVKKDQQSVMHNEVSGTSEVLIRGDRKVEKIIIDGVDRKDIKELLNEANKGVDKKLEKKMKENTELLSMFGL